MAWIVPKLDWTPSDNMNYTDFNRIENNIKEVADYLNSIQYNIVGIEENTYALKFDGVDDYVNIGTWVQAALTNGLTMECWVKLHEYPSASQTIMSNFDGGGFGFQWGIPAYPNKLLGAASLGGDYRIITSDLVPALNRWYHLAYVYDGAQVRFHVDGVLQGVPINITGNIAPPTTGSPFIIGGNPNGTAPAPTEFFNGCVDDVRIWNYARTHQQIQDSMRRFLKGTEAGLVAYWKCNEGTGTTLVANAGVNGTLVGGTSWTTDRAPVGVVTNRDYYSIPFLSDINRIEQNIDYIRNNFMTPAGYGGAETWTAGKPFDHEDAIRLEQNVKLLIDTGVLVYQSFVYCGTIRAGQSGGLY
jgi:hypothetical protein